MLKLYIGNKNYSSWSMRPWVLLKQAGIPFEEVMVRFDSFDTGSTFKNTLKDQTPTGKVPVLVEGDLAVWDTLAIAEYVAEQYPDKQLWPRDKAARARARSVCAEMHAGFTALRGACPMNIEASLQDIGALAWRDKPYFQAMLDWRFEKYLDASNLRPRRERRQVLVNCFAEGKTDLGRLIEASRVNGEYNPREFMARWRAAVGDKKHGQTITADDVDRALADRGAL